MMLQPLQIYLFKLISLAVLAHFVAQTASTGIHIFTDTECTQSLNNITGPNGYPDGKCTNFSEWAPSKFLSFQVVDLDPGCNVTIYGSDFNRYICSSKVVEIAQVSRCYNTSWVYYSIDGCIEPDETPSIVTGKGQNSSTGAIVGGVVGGVVALASVIGAILYSRRSRKLQREIQAHNAQLRQDLYELASKRQPAELMDRRSPVEMDGEAEFPVVTRKASILPNGEENEQMGASKQDQERRD